MGMTISKQEHEKFHKGAPALSPKQHTALMKRLGVTPEQDEEWHRTHLTLAEQHAQGLRQISPSAVGSAFLEWCLKEGWLVRQNKQLYATPEGVRGLGERFEIKV